MAKSLKFYPFLILMTIMISCKMGNKKSLSDKIDIPVNKEVMAKKVIRDFQYAWQGYMKNAYGFDDLRPVSSTGHNWYGRTFVMTPVDGFDTMVLMGLEKEAGEAKKLILDSLDFNRDIFVQNFEITIRLLGGLISAFQLDGDSVFLYKAIDLGNRLLPAFNSPTGMPYWGVNLATGEVKNPVSNPAEIGTLMLEFGTLSKLTGNPVYYEKAKKAVVALFNLRSPIGLVGDAINVETGTWISLSSHLGGRIDSYYEYLLKSYLLFDDPEFKTMWQKSLRSINKYLADSTSGGLWFGQSNAMTGDRTGTRFGALEAFFPALLTLNGSMDEAASLQESCYKMWTLYGIEPEQLDYTTMKVTSSGYILRPENIESVYYLYHFTKDQKYLEMGKTYFESLEKYCKVEGGFTSLRSVITKEKGDDMESFFLAETLKYLYLLFAPEENINLNSIIFNTEAHPIRKTW